jgi:antibiotic biosynthesis monooxygenase (ABM) superfamily enzyme
MQPPNPSHPGEWVTVYSFASVDQLEAWLRSDARRGLMAEVEQLLDGPVREQRVAALPATPEPVTVVFSQRIAAANEAAFVKLHADVVDRLRGFEGFLGSDLFPPVDGIQDEHVIVASFASRSDLDRWLDSGVRQDWLDRVEQLIEGDRTMNVVGGFGGWFPAHPARPGGPKRWKQAVAVLIALFPTVLVITVIRNAIAPNMNLVLSILVGNIISVAILSFLLMPRLTRMMAPWLNR